MSPRPAVLAVGCCLALAACGGSTLDDEKGERLIRAELEKVTGNSGIKVSCPDDREVKKGDVFDCQAVALDGTKVPVEVRQKDDKGNVHFESPVLHTGEAQTNMAKAVAGTKQGVAIDCPDLVLPVKGKAMRCEAAAGDGSKADVTVRFNGNAGGFNVVDVKER